MALMQPSSQTGKHSLISKHHTTLALPFLTSKLVYIGKMPKRYCVALCRHHCKTGVQKLQPGGVWAPFKLTQCVPILLQ